MDPKVNGQLQTEWGWMIAVYLFLGGVGGGAYAMGAVNSFRGTMDLASSIGLWIGFPPMDQATYLAAVQGYAAQYGLTVEDLDRRALQWAQMRGGRSGRVAWQFIRDLAGELGKPLPL